MATFPRREADIMVLARKMISGFAAHGDVFPHADPAALDALREALATARTEAGKIVAAAKAEIQKDLDAATAKADVEITARAAESEAKIAEIRAGAEEAVQAVAKDTAKELVAALGGTADARSVTAAIAARLKG